MGNICPGETWAPRRAPSVAIRHGACQAPWGSKLFYCAQTASLLVTAAPSRCGPLPAPEAGQWGRKEAPVAPGAQKAGQDPLLARSSCQTRPRPAPANFHLSAEQILLTGNKVCMTRWRRRQGLSTFLKSGVGVKTRVSRFLGR